MKRRSVSRATRLEQSTRSRGRRARAHLARRRDGSHTTRGTRREPRRSLAGWERSAAFAFGLLAGVVIGPLIVSSLSRAAPVRQVSVQGHQRLRAADVAGAAAIVPGEVLARDDRTIAEQLRAHPWIHSARALQLPGGRLLLSVAERQPRAALKTDQGWHWVDAQGVAYAPAEVRELGEHPRLFAAGPIGVGEEVAQLAAGVSVAEQALTRVPALAERGALQIQLPSVDDSEGWVVRNADGTLRAILGLKQLEDRLDILAELLAAPSPEVEAAGEIDLRFSDRAILRAGARGKPASG